MAGSDGISATAGPSGADSSPPASSAANPRIDFYVLEDTASSARLKLACRLAEKAYLASQRALIWHTDRAELQALDELLWTFADGSFVPHEWLTSNSGAENSETRSRESESFGKPPVLLSAGSLPAAEFDFVLNLASDPPPFLQLTRRVAEIVDGDEARRRAGRARFKAYRELGIEPGTIPMRHAQG
ncbi:MAG: DNA polymerase III subunit chi [Steroidobacteraceae bacterium]